MDRRHFKNLDFVLFTVVGLLVIIGLIMIYSATHANTALNHGDPFSFVKKQFAAVVIGIVCMVLLLFFLIIEGFSTYVDHSPGSG